MASLGLRVQGIAEGVRGVAGNVAQSLQVG